MNNEIAQIMVTGGIGVGKTSIIRRANGESLEHIYTPAIQEDKINSLDINGKNINYTLTDMPGGDFAQMRFVLYKKMHAFVFVIDISNQNSIEDFTNIYQEIKNNMENSKDLIFCIALNKIDLRETNDSQNLIPTEKIDDIKKQYNCKIIETSAKEDIHITELFTEIISKLMNSQSYTRQSKKEDKGKCRIE